MKVQYMKPFYTKVTGNKLRLVFAYQYFSIFDDNDIFFFIPIEGKEIIINLDTHAVENYNEVFVFQRNNRFKRIHIHQLFYMEGFQEQIDEIISNNIAKVVDVVPDEVVNEANELLKEIVEFNKANMIDRLLESKDYDSIVKMRGWF